jgi:hypothetical protein
MDFLQLLAKIPYLAIYYPDYVIGLAAVLLGLPKGVDPSNAYLPFGFALLTFGLGRTRVFDMDNWRPRVCATPLVLGLLCWFISGFCLYLYLIDVHYTELPWLR